MLRAFVTGVAQSLLKPYLPSSSPTDSIATTIINQFVVGAVMGVSIYAVVGVLDVTRTLVALDVQPKGKRCMKEGFYFRKVGWSVCLRPFGAHCSGICLYLFVKIHR